MLTTIPRMRIRTRITLLTIEILDTGSLNTRQQLCPGLLEDLVDQHFHVRGGTQAAWAQLQISIGWLRV